MTGTTTLVSAVSVLAENIKTQIEAISITDVEPIKVILYDPAVSIVRGIYAVNVLPRAAATREFTGIQTLPDYTYSLVLYRPLEADEEYAVIWVELMNVANEICDKLFKNLIDGVSTCKLDVEFNDDILEKRGRLINCTITCMYKKYASR